MQICWWFVSVCTCNTVEVVFDYHVFCKHHVAVVIFCCSITMTSNSETPLNAPRTTTTKLILLFEVTLSYHNKSHLTVPHTCTNPPAGNLDVLILLCVAIVNCRFACIPPSKTSLCSKPVCLWCVLSMCVCVCGVCAQSPTGIITVSSDLIEPLLSPSPPCSS